MEMILDIAVNVLFGVVLLAMGCVTYWCWNDDDRKVIEGD